MIREFIEKAIRKMYTGNGTYNRYAVISEVSNSTGYAASRWIDLLVIELFPSDGCHLHAIEIKCSRSDLVREVKDFDKSWAIERYCDYFSVALPEGMSMPPEVPADWGVLRVDESGRAKFERKPKQRRDVWPPNRPLIAAIARRMCGDPLFQESIKESEVLR